jgi:hypothetical protein
MKFHNIQQNTDAWLNLRAGKISGSKLGIVMANYGKAFGEPAKKYAVDIAVERMTGKPITSSFSNDHMQRGHEQEPIARSLYEREMFCNVENGGFFCDEYLGCSPDGLVGDSGIIEIKSVIPSVHYKNILRKSFDPAYKWQCLGNLLFTGREFIDFVSFCDDFPEGKNLFTYRAYLKNFDKEASMIRERVSQFIDLVDECCEKISTATLMVE